MADIPMDVPLILGDLLYCLRSALDQTVWQLAKLKVPYPEGTQFPILDKCNSRSRRTFADYTAGAPARAAKAIESLQPYHRVDPSAHLLWRLNKLCNIDKHRRIPVRGDVFRFNFPHPTEAFLRSIVADEEKHMVSVPIDFKSQMALDPDISFDVFFGDTGEGVSCNLEGIASIYEFVADNVIPGFKRFFV